MLLLKSTHYRAGADVLSSMWKVNIQRTLTVYLTGDTVLFCTTGGIVLLAGDQLFFSYSDVGLDAGLKHNADVVRTQMLAKEYDKPR